MGTGPRAILLMENLYSEPRDAGNHFRATYFAQVQQLISQCRAESAIVRKQFFAPDYSSVPAYEASLEPLRAAFRQMLGFPLIDTPSHDAEPQVQETFVAEDALGRIFRLQIEALPGYQIYGLLYLPHGASPHQLVISQHGGGGTPELTAGFIDSANYNDMTRRLVRRGFAVFAPQLFIGGEDFSAEIDRRALDTKLKQLGGSITALELFGLKRVLDALLARPDVKPGGAGMCGLSYGGFYTLFAAANDQRIRAAVSSCFVNDRFVYDWSDWTWGNAAHQFLDSEVAALVCPRPLYIEVGERDELFAADSACPVLQEIGEYYVRLGLRNRFASCVFDGGHEFAKTADSIDFLARHLGIGV